MVPDHPWSVIQYVLTGATPPLKVPFNVSDTADVATSGGITVRASGADGGGAGGFTGVFGFEGVPELFPELLEDG